MKSEWVSGWWAGEMGAAGRILDVALWPAEQLFRGMVRLRNLAYDREWIARRSASIPVISIGNIGVGGAGKTPFAAWVAAMLERWGQEPAIVLRGYGEDETRLHRELNPSISVYADAERIRGVERAASDDHTVAVLDDAFQHRALRRDLDVVLVSVESWVRRRRLLPRGPWREDAAALRRADLLVLTRKIATTEELQSVRREISDTLGETPIVECLFAVGGLTRLHERGSAVPGWDPLGDRPVLAVAALADPLPFAQHLREAGLETELVRYPDHHDFSARDVGALVHRAAGRAILMTHKDAVKLRELIAPDIEAYVVHQEIVIGAGMAALEVALRAATGVPAS